MSDVPLYVAESPGYDVCQRDGCSNPVSVADPRENERRMNLASGQYCSIICQREAEGQ